MTGHNHYYDCTCGWCTGGDKGSQRTGKVERGAEWSSTKPPPHKNYLDYNARCPVCGQDVFFYQSPNGGRVFFDELGVPWPKHPCTDNGSSYLRAPALHSIRFKHHDRTGQGWKPFIFTHVRRDRLADQFYVDQRHVAIDRRSVFLPSSGFGKAPMFWKNSEEDGHIDVISLKVGASKVEIPAEFTSLTFTTPTFAVSALHFAALTLICDLEGEQHNQVGRSLSFDIFASKRSVESLHRDFDLEMAVTHFLLSAEKGCWKGSYNLGLLYLGLLGHEKDEVRAFRLFQEAAESREERAIRQLVDCYRQGIGTAVDLEAARDLEQSLDLEVRGR